MSSGEVIFSPRAMRGLVAAALVSLLASLYLLLWPGEPARVDSVDADGYSRSAIGHQGLLRLLRDLDMSVLQLRHRRSGTVDGLHVLAEPGHLLADEVTALQGVLAREPVSLLVLAKRRGERDAHERAWIGDSNLRALETVEEPLCDLLGLRHGGVVRVASAARWHSSFAWPAPEIVAPLQLLDADALRMETLIGCEHGALLARIGNVHVLSDPDILANHGLHRGRNAELICAMLRELSDAGTIVFDETVHGHLLQPSVFAAAGRFPLVLVPVHLLLLAALTLWIAAGRFGARVSAPPALAPGKRFLIDNTVALLQHTGRDVGSLSLYLQICVHRAAERMHAPSHLDRAGCRAWLLEHMRDESLRQELEQLLARSPEHLTRADALALARRVHAITEEKLHVIA